jgi:hypothetical protein
MPWEWHWTVSGGSEEIKHFRVWQLSRGLDLSVIQD